MGLMEIVENLFDLGIGDSCTIHNKRSYFTDLAIKIIFVMDGRRAYSILRVRQGFLVRRSRDIVSIETAGVYNG